MFIYFPTQFYITMFIVRLPGNFMGDAVDTNFPLNTTLNFISNKYTHLPNQAPVLEILMNST